MSDIAYQPPDGWTLTASADGKTVTLLSGTDDEQRSIVVSECTRTLTLALGTMRGASW
jgi:hypothetical protein